LIRALLYLIVLLMLSLAQNAVAEDRTVPDKIRITSGEWPPFSSTSLPHLGYSSHIVTEALAAEGVDVEWTFMPWQRAYVAAQLGSFDATAVWQDLDDRQLSFLTSDVLFEGDEVLFMHRDNRFDFNSPAQRRGTVIGGHMANPFPYLKHYVNTGEIEFVPFPSYKYMFRTLVGRRVDGIVIDRRAGDYILRHSFPEADVAKIVTAPTPLKHQRYHLMVSKRSDRAQAILETFNRGLAKIRASGRLAEINAALDKGVYDVAPKQPQPGATR
jgi:polar amino acid transport system substrate-binding protein